MLQYLAITAFGQRKPEFIKQIAGVIADHGANIIDSRTTLLGQEFALLLLIAGAWDAIAKIEDQMDRLSADSGLQILWRRTDRSQQNITGMPYAIDVVCADRPGVVFEIARFIADNGFQIRDMFSNTYCASQSNTQMFSLHMSITVPTDVSIATLRGDFMDFCDRLNLDAIIEPVK